MSNRSSCARACTAILLAWAASAAAATPSVAPAFAWYGQSTFTEQATDGFHAPYAGTNSLTAHIGRETSDVTLYLGAHLWQGGELWLNPEVDQ